MLLAMLNQHTRFCCKGSTIQNIMDNYFWRLGQTFLWKYKPDDLNLVDTTWQLHKSFSLCISQYIMLEMKRIIQKLWDKLIFEDLNLVTVTLNIPIQSFHMTHLFLIYQHTKFGHKQFSNFNNMDEQSFFRMWPWPLNTKLFLIIQYFPTKDFSYSISIVYKLQVKQNHLPQQQQQKQTKKLVPTMFVR